MVKVHGSVFAAELRRVELRTLRSPSAFDELVDDYHLARKLTNRNIPNRNIRWDGQTKTFNVRPSFRMG